MNLDPTGNPPCKVQVDPTKPPFSLASSFSKLKEKCGNQWWWPQRLPFIRDIVHDFRPFLRGFGFGPNLIHLRCKRNHLIQEIWRTPPAMAHPVAVRAGASDVDVFCQIFCDREYAGVGEGANVRSVIDCGANVGYSSVYFLNRFPACHVLAVEPDAGNFAQLQKNLAQYPGRFGTLRSAVWSKNAGLIVSSPPDRGGLTASWEVHVREAADGEQADMTATTIPDLIAQCPGKRVDILKIDVEGAEQNIFAEDCSSWLPKVDTIVIELHGPKAEQIFAEAISNQSFKVSRSLELTICQRSRS